MGFLLPVSINNFYGFMKSRDILTCTIPSIITLAASREIASKLPRQFQKNLDVYPIIPV